MSAASKLVKIGEDAIAKFQMEYDSDTHDTDKALEEYQFLAGILLPGLIVALKRLQNG